MDNLEISDAPLIGQVAELVDAKIMGGQRAIGEEPRKLRIQVRILSWLLNRVLLFNYADDGLERGHFCLAIAGLDVIFRYN